MARKRFSREQIITMLLEAGVPKGNIVIWDRRLFQLEAAWFTATRFPGIRILGTEMKGKSSYFTKIVNVPILKNAGATATCCLKNLSYGSLSNTSRLHKLWMKSVAEPCAFPVLRDKVVLNIVDGLQACYDGGPGANPKFIYDANVLLFGTDPVAVDAVAHDIIVKERMARGVQQVEEQGRSAFLELAEGLGLGIAAREKIQVSDVPLG